MCSNACSSEFIDVVNRCKLFVFSLGEVRLKCYVALAGL